MPYTQIGVTRKMKAILDQRKRQYEVAMNKELTWDEYLDAVTISLKDLPEKASSNKSIEKPTNLNCLHIEGDNDAHR